MISLYYIGLDSLEFFFVREQNSDKWNCYTKPDCVPEITNSVKIYVQEFENEILEIFFQWKIQRRYFYIRGIFRLNPVDAAVENIKNSLEVSVNIDSTFQGLGVIDVEEYRSFLRSSLDVIDKKREKNISLQFSDRVSSQQHVVVLIEKTMVTFSRPTSWMKVDFLSVLKQSTSRLLGVVSTFAPSPIDSAMQRYLPPLWQHHCADYEVMRLGQWGPAKDSWRDFCDVHSLNLDDFTKWLNNQPLSNVRTAPIRAKVSKFIRTYMPNFFADNLDPKPNAAPDVGAKVFGYKRNGFVEQIVQIPRFSPPPIATLPHDLGRRDGDVSVGSHSPGTPNFVS